MAQLYDPRQAETERTEGGVELGNWVWVSDQGPQLPGQAPMGHWEQRSTAGAPGGLPLPLGSRATAPVVGKLAQGASPLWQVPTAAATSAATSSLWSKLLQNVIPAAAPAVGQLLETKMQIDANQKASDAEIQAAREALDWQKQVYGTRQKQLAPAIGVGNAATLRLGELMGLQAPPGGYQPDLPTDIPPGGTPAGTAQPRGPQAPPPQAAPSPQATVRLRAPTGAISEVPADQVEHYLSLGATRV